MTIAKTFIFLLATYCITPPYAFAQQKPSIGLHHLTPKPAAPVEQTPVAPTPEKTESPSTNIKTTEQAALPTYKTLAPKDALVKIEDLEKWSNLDKAATASSDEDIKNLVYTVESDRGAVPPLGLFLTAKALSDKHQMEQAALYFFVGQLRISFDVSRWPPRANEDDIKRITQDSKKTGDQVSPNMGAEPRINNPHAGVFNLSNAIGQPIIAWAMKDPDHLATIINQAREWDASAPYAYSPDYDLTEPIPFDKWERMLIRVRENYFSHMGKMIDAIKKVKAQ